ncbi:MAG: uroporphyrinogen decarboxylase family protein [Armatimonadota bacterium]
MNLKENYLEAVRFGRPDHVPLANEPIIHSFEFEGNLRIENWTDLWGVRWEVGLAGTVPFPKGNPLPTLDRLSDYTFPTSDQLGFTEEMKDRLRPVDRGERLVIGHLTYLLFERAWAIMGMDNFLVALITHPREAHAYLHGIASYARDVFDRYLELGVDGVGFSEDLGSQRALMISPAMFREFILPEYVFCFEHVLRAKKMVMFHSCGCIDAIAGDLAGIGVTVLNPIQARANDLGKVKRETIGRMALNGGIDTSVLALGKPEDVRAEVIRVMEILKPGGGYICGPDQSIPGIPEENTEAMWETAREVGRY